MKKAFGFNDLILYNDEYWVASNKWNGLYKIHSEMENVEFIKEFPEEERNQENLYMRTALFQTKIIFAPSCAKKVAIYDIKENKFTMLKIKNGEMPDKFHDVVIYEKYVFLIPHRYFSILKIDLTDYSIEYINGWLDDLKNISGTKMPGFVFAKKMEDRLLLPQFISNVVMEFNFKTEAYHFLKVDGIKNNITGIEKYKGRLYLCAENVIYELNEANQIVERRATDRMPKNVYIYMICFGENILLLPIGQKGFATGMSITFKPSNSKERLTEVIDKCYGPFSCIRRIKNKLFLFSCILNKFIIVDLLTGVCIEREIEVVKDISDTGLKYRQRIREEVCCRDLGYMIQELSDIEINCNRNDNRGKVGEVIWQECKKVKLVGKI